jgi:hypothetical protein
MRVAMLMPIKTIFLTVNVTPFPLPIAVFPAFTHLARDFVPCGWVLFATFHLTVKNRKIISIPFISWIALVRTFLPFFFIWIYGADGEGKPPCSSALAFVLDIFTSFNIVSAGRLTGSRPNTVFESFTSMRNKF